MRRQCLGLRRRHSITLSTSLRTEYLRLFSACEVVPARLGEVEAVSARMMEARFRYKAVGYGLGVPWWFIGAIHSLESQFDFSRHLHNGDPLSARTIHVPRGRPTAGAPPFTWEESAADALILEGLDRWSDWSIPGTLFQLERYNGWGYRLFHPTVLSPYLWSGSQHYTRGKYMGDHRWSHTVVSTQVGAAVLLKALHADGQIRFAPSGRRLSLIPVPPRRRVRASGKQHQHK